MGALTRDRRGHPAAVILQTGRSGSGYVAQVLTSCGVPCGHEEAYGYEGYAGHTGKIVESSWLAVLNAPFPPNTHVWHQVRHPANVIRSRVTAPLTHRQGPYHGPKTRLMEFTGDLVLDAARWYVTCNEECERWATRRWRVEDVDAELVAELASELGVPCDPNRVYTVPRDINQHTSPTTPWSLDDLSHGPERDAVLRLGWRYGYL